MPSVQQSLAAGVEAGNGNRFHPQLRELIPPVARSGELPPEH